MTRAWTLGTPEVYERAVRMAGNAKAPGGYAFRTKAEAEAYAHHRALRYGAYEMELPGSFDDCTTDSYAAASAARHDWHVSAAGPGGKAVAQMPGCGVCEPWRLAIEDPLDCRLLTVCAPFINPDTGVVV